jgi:hypothetical protein
MVFVLHTFKLDRPPTYVFCHNDMSCNDVVRLGKWEDKKESDANRNDAKTGTMWMSYMMTEEWSWWWTNRSGSGLGSIGGCCSFMILTSLDDII